MVLLLVVICKRETVFLVLARFVDGSGGVSFSSACSHRSSGVNRSSPVRSKHATSPSLRRCRLVLTRQRRAWAAVNPPPGAATWAWLICGSLGSAGASRLRTAENDAPLGTADPASAGKVGAAAPCYCFSILNLPFIFTLTYPCATKLRILWKNRLQLFHTCVFGKYWL